MHCLVIEDNEKTLRQLRSLFEADSAIQVTYIHENLEEALNISLQQDVEVLLLNLDTKKLNILELLLEIKSYSEGQIEIIGLSKKKKAAYLAYKYELFDFILKPISDHSIRKTLLKLKKKQLTKQWDTICLRSNKDYRYLKTSEIIFLKADNNTTDFFMADGTTISAYKTLKTYQKILPSNFLRIHRSYIINKDYVTRIQFGNQTCTLQKNQIKLPFTKSFVDNIHFINSLYPTLHQISN